MRKLLFILMFICNLAWATDNSIKMGYNYVTVSQNVVFNSSMQSGGTLSFSAQVADGGGRSPGDPFTMKLVFYNSGGGIVNTVQQSWTLVLGAAASTYTLNATDCGSSCSTVAYVSVQFYGKDGGYWAGNYGPYIQSPSLTFNGGTNILYNPEFGIYTGTAAHGWTSSNGWQSCQLYSGTNTCVTNNGASVNGGNYDPYGGTTAGTAGGYAVSGPTTLTTTGTSLGPTATQAAKKSSAITRRDSYSDNGIYVDQVGSNNSISILQESTNNQLRGIDQQKAKMWGNSNTYDIRQGASSTTGINLIELMVDGDSNNLTLWQDRYSNGLEDTSASGDHILRINVDGNSNTVATNQRGQINSPGHFGEINITGNTNSVTLNQAVEQSATAFIDVTGNSNLVNLNQTNSLGNGSHFASIKLTGDGHEVNLTQNGAGNHSATIDLTYGTAPSTVNLNQLGNTSQSYNFSQICYDVGGCSATVTQQ